MDNADTKYIPIPVCCTWCDDGRDRRASDRHIKDSDMVCAMDNDIGIVLTCNECDFYEECSDDEDCCVSVTNRQELITEIEAAVKRVPGVTEIEHFDISGITFKTKGMSNEELYSLDYINGCMLQKTVEKGAISDEWLDMDTNELWLAVYHLDESIYDADWVNENTVISVELEKPEVIKHVGHAFSCRCNEAEGNHMIEINDETLGVIEVKIIGIHVMEILDEKVLMLEYEAPDNIVPNFYSTAYLDDEMGYGGSDGVCVYGVSGEQSSRYDFIGYMEDENEYENGEIELELFSYAVM